MKPPLVIGDNVPLLGATDATSRAVRALLSTSVSLARIPRAGTTSGTFSVVAKTSATAVGASLTAVTVIVTVAGVALTPGGVALSRALYVNDVTPEKFKAGRNVNEPLALSVNVPALAGTEVTRTAVSTEPVSGSVSLARTPGAATLNAAMSSVVV